MVFRLAFFLPVALCTVHKGDYLLQTVDQVLSAETIQGNLVIDENYDGLVGDVNFPNLKYIDGNLTIPAASNVKTFGLNNVEIVKGDINIKFNKSLESLTLSLKSCEGTINVEGNSKLKTLNLLQLESVKGQAKFYGKVMFSLLLRDNSLEDIMMPALQSIAGSLSIHTVSTLRTLSFPNLKSAGQINISGPIPKPGNALQEISMPKLVVVHGLLSIYKHANLKTLDLGKLKTIESKLQVHGCEAIQEIALPSLTAVQETVNISSNHGLRVLDLSELELVEGGFEVQHNRSLEQMAAPLLQRTGGSISLYFNTNMKIIDLPEVLSCGGMIHLNKNDELLGVMIPKLVTLNGQVEIIRNAKLTSVDLRSLKTIKGSFNFSGNVNLQEVCATSLISIERALSFYDNQLLESINLPNLETVKDSLSIKRNLSLEQVVIPKVESLGGKMEVIDNRELHIIDLSNLCTIDGDRSKVIFNFHRKFQFLDLTRLVSIGKNNELYVQASADAMRCENNLPKESWYFENSIPKKCIIAMSTKFSINDYLKQKALQFQNVAQRVRDASSFGICVAMNWRTFKKLTPSKRSSGLGLMALDATAVRTVLAMIQPSENDPNLKFVLQKQETEVGRKGLAHLLKD